MEQENDNYLFVDKKQFCLSMIVLTVIAISLFLFSFIILNDKIENINSLIKELDNEVVFQEQDTNTELEETYMIKEYNDKIGIFANGSLEEIIDIYVFPLTENDKQLLSEGIYVSSRQELYEILSCYY